MSCDSTGFGFVTLGEREDGTCALEFKSWNQYKLFLAVSTYPMRFLTQRPPGKKSDTDTAMFLRLIHSERHKVPSKKVKLEAPRRTGRDGHFNCEKNKRSKIAFLMHQITSYSQY